MTTPADHAVDVAAGCALAGAAMTGTTTSAAIAAFVERVRARRAAAGQPEHLADDGLYRVLDGLLARVRQPLPLRAEETASS